MAPACLDASGGDQRCKFLCAPDNTPNYVVGGQGTAEHMYDINTYSMITSGTYTG